MCRFYAKTNAPLVITDSIVGLMFSYNQSNDSKIDKPIVNLDYLLDPLFPFLFTHNMTTKLTYSSFRIDKINVNR